MNHNLLCIVGPTATGKTNLTLEFASKQPSILISADSRQVYRGMDIVTGKDHPNDIALLGIDLLDPGEENSVSVWHDAVYPHLIKAWEKGILPIVVGGTGLYVKSLTNGISTMSVPINSSLRQKLNNLTVKQLQLQLLKLDKPKYESMNHSDQHNPRRLIRAIEVASSPAKNTHISSIQNPHSKLIGLFYSDPDLHLSKIRQRVVDRLAMGALTEAKRLAKSASRQALSAIGYRSLIQHLEGKLSYDEMIDAWVKDELSYAKRQMTWFRTQPVTWYDRGIIDIKEIKI